MGKYKDIVPNEKETPNYKWDTESPNLSYVALIYLKTQSELRPKVHTVHI